MFEIVLGWQSSVDYQTENVKKKLAIEVLKKTDKTYSMIDFVINNVFPYETLPYIEVKLN